MTQALRSRTAWQSRLQGETSRRKQHEIKREHDQGQVTEGVFVMSDFVPWIEVGGWICSNDRQEAVPIAGGK